MDLTSAGLVRQKLKVILTARNQVVNSDPLHSSLSSTCLPEPQSGLDKRDVDKHTKDDVQSPDDDEGELVFLHIPGCSG